MRKMALMMLVSAILMVTGIRVEAATYVVKSGDTLSKIAKKFNTSVGKIAKDNDIRNINRLRKGQTLVVPDGKSAKTKTQTGFTADGRGYVTDGSESCEQVAAKVGVPAERLMEAFAFTSTSTLIPKWKRITVVKHEKVVEKSPPVTDVAADKIQPTAGIIKTVQTPAPVKSEVVAAQAAPTEEKPKREITWRERILQQLDETSVESSKKETIQTPEEKITPAVEPQKEIEPCTDCQKAENANGKSEEQGHDWTQQPEDFSGAENNNLKRWFHEPTAGAFVNISDGKNGIGATMFGGFAELAGWREGVHSDGRAKLGFSLGYDIIASYLYGSVRSSDYKWDEVAFGGGIGLKYVGNSKGHQYQDVLKVRLIYEMIDGKNSKSGYKMTQDSILLNPYFEHIWRFDPTLIGGFVAEGKVGLSKNIKSTWKDDKPSSRDMALGSLFLQKAFTEHWQGRGTVSGIYQGWNDGKGIELGAEARLNETYMFGVKVNHIFSAKEGDSNGLIFYVRGEWGTPLRAVKPIAASQTSQEVK